MVKKTENEVKMRARMNLAYFLELISKNDCFSKREKRPGLDPNSDLNSESLIHMFLLILNDKKGNLILEKYVALKFQ